MRARLRLRVRTRTTPRPGRTSAPIITVWNNPMPRKKAPTVDERLGSLDRDQLEALVRRLLEHRPELEDVLHLPLPGEQLQVDPAYISGQVRRILHNMGSDWQASYRSQFELDPIKSVGDGYLEQDLVDDARGVYDAIAQAIIKVYEQIRDEESEIGRIVIDCAKGLGRCLERTSDSGQRKRLLADLFAIYRWDELETGGYGIADPVREVISAQANYEERRLLARWVRDALPVGDDKFMRWRRQRAGRFLMELEADRLDDDGLVELCEATDLATELAEHWLATDEVERALEVVRNAPGDEVFNLAIRVRAAGHQEEAVPVVAAHETALSPSNHRIRNWLAEQGYPHAEGLTELADALWRWEAQQDFDGFLALREIAQRVERWNDVLPRLYATLVADKPYQRHLVVRIMAAEGAVASALELLPGLKGQYRCTAVLELAAAAEEDWPEEAVKLHMEEVQRHLKTSHRARYRAAAEILERIRAILVRHDRHEQWLSLIQSIRDDHPRSKALHEELVAQGL